MSPRPPGAGPTSPAGQAGYYDAGSTLVLSRPVALIGYPGVAYRQVGHDLASLTGLSLIDLDRWVEHTAGMSLWALLQGRGLEVMRELEARLLAHALEVRPHGLLILGDGALVRPENRLRLHDTAAIVYLHLPLVTAYWELRQQILVNPPGPCPFVPHPLEHCEQLRFL
ncbi:MAG: shikimate kinase, partial [Candidatus Latescibacterota bacterium]